jgi:hypothetical protein
MRWALPCSLQLIEQVPAQLLAGIRTFGFPARCWYFLKPRQLASELAFKLGAFNWIAGDASDLNH